MNISTEILGGGAGTAAFSVVDLRSYLDGSWRLSRRISDYHRDEDGRFDGAVTFAPDRGDLVYREQGTLQLSAYKGVAEQNYRFRFPTVSRAEIWFADGRYFHGLDLTDGRCTATHQCGDDLYAGRFVVHDWSTWQVEWRVTGPRKNTLLISTYTRSGSGFWLRRNRLSGYPEDLSSRSA